MASWEEAQRIQCGSLNYDNSSCTISFGSATHWKDIESGEVLHTWSAGMTALFAPDNSIYETDWDPPRLRQKRKPRDRPLETIVEVSLPDNPTGLRLSRGSGGLVVLTNEPPLLLRGSAPKVATLSIDDSQARSSALSGDGSLLAEATTHVRLWRTADSAPLYCTVRSDEPLRNAFLGPDGV